MHEPACEQRGRSVHWHAHSIVYCEFAAYQSGCQLLYSLKASVVQASTLLPAMGTRADMLQDCIKVAWTWADTLWNACFDRWAAPLYSQNGCCSIWPCNIAVSRHLITQY